MGIDFQFPRSPDWEWLKATYPGDVLLHVDCPFLDVVRRIGGRMAYLATPYTRQVLDSDLQWDSGLSLDLEVRTARWARAFAIEGVTVASPIVMACAMLNADVEAQLDPLDIAFWARWCQPILSASGSVVIPAMDGWDRSRGVWREACWGLQHNVPVYLVAEGSEFGVAL
ncbi:MULTISPECIES: DUF1937 family protein [Phaeobacter]|uniref:DUF1937 family protein n=1 Tax=Phaeobacter TaxID=302485 RepID=UPI0006946E10|nr:MULTISPECIES: DUF1937 family protein [Phaeobacter]AUQ89377.1 hypothetical protein PhaeoP24_00731 [Phaeobacter inhibens]